MERVKEIHLVQLDFQRQLVHDGCQVQKESITGNKARLDIDHGSLFVALQRLRNPTECRLTGAVVHQQRVEYLLQENQLLIYRKLSSWQFKLD